MEREGDRVDDGGLEPYGSSWHQARGGLHTLSSFTLLGDQPSAYIRFNLLNSPSLWCFFTTSLSISFSLSLLSPCLCLFLSRDKKSRHQHCSTAQQLVYTCAGFQAVVWQAVNHYTVTPARHIWHTACMTSKYLALYYLALIHKSTNRTTNLYLSKYIN